MAQTNFCCWDQIYHLESRNIQKPEDRIILLAHWNLIMNNSFKCCGLGNEKYITNSDKESSSELLPDGWNFSNQYNIRYIYNDTLFILIGIKMSNDLLFMYMLHPDTEVLSLITIKVTDVTISNPKNSKIPNLFNSYQLLLNAIQHDLIDVVLRQSGKLKKPTPEILTRTTRKRPIIPQISPHWMIQGNYRNFNWIDDFDNWEVTMAPTCLQVD